MSSTPIQTFLQPIAEISKNFYEKKNPFHDTSGVLQNSNGEKFESTVPTLLFKRIPFFIAIILDKMVVINIYWWLLIVFLEKIGAVH